MMKKTNKSLKEWNAIVEALGQGKQSILIRKYTTHLPGFLLFPTLSYTMKDDYFNNFKEEHIQFIKENALPNKKGDKNKIKYYAKVEKVVEKSSKQISKLNDYHIWNNNHVKNYLSGKNGFIWLLRVYKLEIPYMAKTNRCIKYSNLEKEIDLSNAKPVLDEKEFSELFKVI